jgi:hypothetical protein
VKRCEERLEKKRTERLEEENRLVLTAMEASRRSLEQERSLAAQSGDIGRLVASAPGVARGRGRGITNLPAWMTTQQQEQEQQHQEQSLPSSNPHTDSNERKRGLFTSPSCVLLLKNIEKRAGASLGEEMEAECRKYGSVRSCVVREVQELPAAPPAAAAAEGQGQGQGQGWLLEVFICFSRQESAVRAFRDLNGA